MWINWGRESTYNKELAREKVTAINSDIHKFWEKDMQNSGRTNFYIRLDIQTASQWNHIVLAIL